MKKTKKGFTLVELLVVIAILAILATVSVVGYTSFITKANESVALQELTQIKNYMIAADFNDDNFSITSKEGLKFKGSKTLSDYVGTGKEIELSGTVTVDSTNTHLVKYTIKGATAVWNTKTGEIDIEE